MSKFDKPFRVHQIFDLKKANNLFNLINKLNTHELKIYSLCNQVPLHYINEDGECLIHKVVEMNDKIASQQTKLNVIKFLVLNNVNPDQPNKYNQTPLHLACLAQQDQIIEYLLDIKVNQNFQDNLGQTPFYYLLKGTCKLYESNRINGFIQPPIREYSKKKKIIILLKKNIYNLFIKENNIPLLNTMNNTIKNFLDEDTFINEKKIETLEKIQKMALDISKNNRSSDIKEIIDIGKNAIENNIKMKFNINDEISNIKIHIKNNESWAPNNSNELAIIQNSNIKKTIKKDILKSIDDIQKTMYDFKIINNISNDINKNGSNIVFSSYIIPTQISREAINKTLVYLETDNATETAINWPPLNLHLNDDNYKDNYKVRHTLALDNASCILDYDTLTYVGSSRDITIIHSDFDNFTKYISFEFRRLLLDFDGNIHKQILYLLSSSLTLKRINELIPENNKINIINTTDAINIIDDCNFKCNNLGIPVNIEEPPDHVILAQAEFPIVTNRENALYNPAYNPDINRHVYPEFYFKDLNLCETMKNYIYLAYTAILFPDDFKLIPKKLEKRFYRIKPNLSNPALEPSNAMIDASFFMNKWYNIYITTVYNEPNKLSSWLFNMWCDLMCKESESNLDCKITFRLLMLINSLQNNEKNISIQGIINAYKPHLMILLFNKSRRPNGTDDLPEFFGQWILLLLNNNISAIPNSTFENFDNPDEIYGKKLKLLINNLPKDLDLIYILIKNYLENKLDPAIPLDDIIFNTYAIKNKSRCDIICKMILTYYDNLQYKPLKQNILDTIYYLKKIDSEPDVVPGRTTNINIINIIKDFKKLYDLKFNQHDTYMNTANISFNTIINNQKFDIINPTSFSYLNYLIDKEKNNYDNTDNINYRHYKISNLLGLYYLGLFYKTDFNLSNFIRYESSIIDSSQKEYNIALSIISDNNEKFNAKFDENIGYKKKKDYHYFVNATNNNFANDATNDTKLFEYSLPLTLNYIFISNYHVDDIPTYPSPHSDIINRGIYQTQLWALWPDIVNNVIRKNIIYRDLIQHYIDHINSMINSGLISQTSPENIKIRTAINNINDIKIGIPGTILNPIGTPGIQYYEASMNNNIRQFQADWNADWDAVHIALTRDDVPRHILNILSNFNNIRNRFNEIYDIVKNINKEYTLIFRSLRIFNTRPIIIGLSNFAEVQIVNPATYTTAIIPMESTDLPYYYTPIHRNHIRIYNKLNFKNKNIYYNVKNRSIHIPTFHSYLLLLLNRIYYYQHNIINFLNKCYDILNNLIVGTASSLFQIYVIYFPSIVINYNILKNLNKLYENLINNDSFNVNNLSSFIKTIKINNYNLTILINNLNNINFNYFLYYYIFSPTKTIKINKFNYFQIPIDTLLLSNYNFLHDINPGNTKLIHLINDEEIPNDSIEEIPQDPIIDNIFPLMMSSFEKELHDKQFSINSASAYNDIYNEYNNYQFFFKYKSELSIYKQYKSTKIPPSLYNSLHKLYKYSLIIIIKEILKNFQDKLNVTLNPLDSEDQQKEKETITNIKNSVDNLISNLTLKNNEQNNEILLYYIIANIIKELIKNQINIYIKNNINNIYIKILQSTNLTATETYYTNDIGEFNINLSDSNFDITNINSVNLLKYLNTYLNTNIINDLDLVKNISKENIFIIYPNDLNNINKLKDKYYIYINKEIINKLLKYKSSPYINNTAGISAIDSIIKTCNYDIINEFKKSNINFNNINNNLFLNYLIKDNNNNINKILCNVNNINDCKLVSIFDNISNFLYNDLIALILSNEKFGNNIVINLDYSFYISSYITIQYLSEHLLNFNKDFTIDNLQFILSMINISLDKISLNYLSENLSKYSIPGNIQYLVLCEIKKKYIKKNNENNKKYEEYEDTIIKLNNYNNLIDKIKASTEHLELTKDMTANDNLIRNLNDAIDTIASLYPMKNNYSPTNNKKKIINRYDDLYANHLQDYGLIIEGWKRMLLNKMDNNHNLILFYLLEKQKQYINLLKTSGNNKENLEEINKTMKHLSLLCEKYFNDLHFTNNNKILLFIEDLLVYLTKIILGYSIEMIITKILFTYFINTELTDLDDANLLQINTKIEYIFTKNIAGIDLSLRDYLYNKICVKLVKNCSEIFIDNNEKKGHITESVRDILSEYFELFNLSPITLSIEILNILKIDVVNYYDSFILKIITLWHVNTENIFKYIINNYRCLQTTLYMIE